MKNKTKQNKNKESKQQWNDYEINVKIQLKIRMK